MEEQEEEKGVQQAAEGPPLLLRIQRGSWREGAAGHPAAKAVSSVFLSSVPYGIAGAVFGTSWAVFRGKSLAHYSSSLGASYLLLAVTFNGTEKALSYAMGNDRSTWLCHALSGALTGGMCGFGFGGRATALKGAALFTFAGLGMYFIGERWEEKKAAWRETRIQELAGLRPKHTMFADWRKRDDQIPESFSRWMDGSAIDKTQRSSTLKKPAPAPAATAGAVAPSQKV